MIKKGEYHKGLDDSPITDKNRHEVALNLIQKALMQASSHIDTMICTFLRLSKSGKESIEFLDTILSNPPSLLGYRTFYVACHKILHNELLTPQEIAAALLTGHQDSSALCDYQEFIASPDNHNGEELEPAPTVTLASNDDDTATQPGDMSPDEDLKEEDQHMVVAPSLRKEREKSLHQTLQEKAASSKYSNRLISKLLQRLLLPSHGLIKHDKT